MTVQAEISVYPFGEADLSPAIEDFVAVLREEGLDPQMGPMSTVVAGDGTIIFSAIAKAFGLVAGTHRCAMIVKYSNACAPIEWK
jgi:uncharacterized protein YqgV (UPF0045/DUF77 family)